ncbi:hypothetical protein [Quadrisphaera setariae]|uniref:Uncharacterized protein n=1 Tax=Quadrisphaera setariae TaxID=2593304 RepID=A0A5C8ZDS5_9ACTN|nr:hypothetical protein [Quadrisphaera setariae]TXR55449.1 hypothetical protein FMM08_14095 [Quadrisphaera setariae]
MVSRTRRVRRLRLAAAGAAAALVLTGTGVWLATTPTPPSVPVPLSLLQRHDLHARVLLVAREVEDPSSTPSPQERATHLADRADLRGEAVTDVAAYAQKTADEQAVLARTGSPVTDTEVELESMSATRQLGGPLRVCARIHSTHDVQTGPAWQEVTPWVFTVDPGDQHITDVEVQDWDGGGHTC